jgi:hypothetical protein
MRSRSRSTYRAVVELEEEELMAEGEHPGLECGSAAK